VAYFPSTFKVRSDFALRQFFILFIINNIQGYTFIFASLFLVDPVRNARQLTGLISIACLFYNYGKCR